MDLSAKRASGEGLVEPGGSPASRVTPYPLAVPLASITGSITSAIGDHGLYAVFVLMAIDAVFPAASELVMLYAGALAGGAFAAQHVVVFGTAVTTARWAFVTV